MVDGFNWDPTADCSPVQTAENVAKENGFTREQSDAMAVARYNKYAMALENDRDVITSYSIHYTKLYELNSIPTAMWGWLLSATWKR